jgi:hypothetical protein
LPPLVITVGGYRVATEGTCQDQQKLDNHI